MKDTRPTMEQLASLTAKQRKNILIYGISVIAVSVVVLAVILVWFFGQLDDNLGRREKAYDMDVYYVAGYIDGEPIELRDEEKVEKQERILDRLDEEFEQLMITTGIIFVIWLAAIGILYLIQRKTIPYYTEMRFYALLGATLTGKKFPTAP